MRISAKIGAALFALVIGVATIHRAQKLGSPDFKVFYAAARHALTEPANLYNFKLSPDRYLYPPATAILLTPFAFSENYAFHQWAWHALLALMVFALAAVGGAQLAAMIILSRYLAITFGYGQVNLFLMVLLALAAARLARAPGKAGALWAFAAGLKVYPLVFAPAFLPKANRRGLWVGAGVGFGILTLPFLFFGPSLGATLYGEFLQSLELKGTPLHSHNQSIVALLLRLFTDEFFELHAVGPAKWTLFVLPTGLVKAAAWLIALKLLLPTWWRAFRRGGAESFLSAAAFSVIFLSHIVWKDYLLWLYFPLAEIFTRVPRRQAWLLGGTVLALVTLSAPDVAGAVRAAWLDAAGIHLWAAILVWVVWWRR